MSYGDEIMASGQAWNEHKRAGARVHILDKRGRPRWSDLWRGLDYIAHPNDPAGGRVVNGPGCRPYVEYPFTRAGGQKFTAWRARDNRGKIALSLEERSYVAERIRPDARFVLIEPDIAADGNPNKQWGRERWAALAGMMRDLVFVQALAPGRAPMPGVIVIPTPTFRHAAAVLARAVLAVLPEGGLHHAAAALGVPAVVLFGGAVPPETTGYPEHMNIAASGPACGRWLPCSHCAEYWASLSPSTVASAMRGMLAQGRAVDNIGRCA